MRPREADLHPAIDRALESWRQGDCVLAEQWFVYRTDPVRPLTDEAASAANEGLDLAEARVCGLMVLTQTCDLVRTCRDRPYVEVCPLVEVSADIYREIERGRRPNYACVPPLAARNLVADLDRVMTVEKSVVATWSRVHGIAADADARRLALTLARKRARTAFPDDSGKNCAPGVASAYPIMSKFTAITTAPGSSRASTYARDPRIQSSSSSQHATTTVRPSDAAPSTRATSSAPATPLALSSAPAQPAM